MDDDDLIEALKALAHPLRWRIMTALIAGERNVGEIEATTGIGQPGLSQQLGVLRKAGVVETRKEAKLVFYAVATAQVREALARLAALAPGTHGAAESPAIRDTPAPCSDPSLPTGGKMKQPYAGQTRHRACPAGCLQSRRKRTGPPSTLMRSSS